MTGLIQISTSSDKKETLQLIAGQLLANRLAACVQISGPVESLYRWQGKIESSREWICTIKTATTRQLAVEAAIRDGHHYDEPEIIASPVTGGSESFLQWWKDQVTEL